MKKLDNVVGYFFVLDTMACYYGNQTCLATDDKPLQLLSLLLSHVGILSLLWAL